MKRSLQSPSTGTCLKCPPFLQGVIAPLYTPFYPDGRLDEAGLANLIKWLRRRPVNTLFVRSGMGQMWQYTLEEAKRAFRLAAEAAEGEIPFLCGCAGQWDRDLAHRPEPQEYITQSIELAEEAARVGAQAAVLPVPLAIESHAPSAEEVIHSYYEQMAAQISLPIFIYFFPGLPPEYWITGPLFERLQQLPGICGIKVSYSEEEVVRPIAEATRPGVAFVCGNEGNFLRDLGWGASGVIGQGCNAYPDILSALFTAYKEGDITRAVQAQEAVRQALEAVRGTNAAVLLKQYLRDKGVDLQPFNRGVTELYPDSRVEEVARVIDTLLPPYQQVHSQR